jgi:hypothetical protein
MGSYIEKPLQPFADKPLEESLILENCVSQFAAFMTPLTLYFNSRRNHTRRQKQWEIHAAQEVLKAPVGAQGLLQL